MLPDSVSQSRAAAVAGGPLLRVGCGKCATSGTIMLPLLAVWLAWVPGGHWWRRRGPPLVRGGGGGECGEVGRKMSPTLAESVPRRETAAQLPSEGAGSGSIVLPPLADSLPGEAGPLGERRRRRQGGGGGGECGESMLRRSSSDGPPSYSVAPGEASVEHGFI
jgi:hypothetical protein